MEAESVPDSGEVDKRRLRRDTGNYGLEEEEDLKTRNSAEQCCLPGLCFPYCTCCL